MKKKYYFKSEEPVPFYVNGNDAYLEPSESAKVKMYTGKDFDTLLIQIEQLKEELAELKRINTEDCISLGLHESRMRAEGDRARDQAILPMLQLKMRYNEMKEAQKTANDVATLYLQQNKELKSALEYYAAKSDSRRARMALESLKDDNEKL